MENILKKVELFTVVSIVYITSFILAPIMAGIFVYYYLKAKIKGIKYDKY